MKTMKEMKKTVAVLLFCAGLFGINAGVFAQSGLISELSGTVELKISGASDFVPAKVGDRVEADTIVSTGFRSTAILTVGSSSITVRPLTRLSLAEISASGGVEEINVSLRTGRIQVDVNPPTGTKTNFTVQSPMATASVRGTSFNFDTRNLEVNHGTVAFRGNSGVGMLVSSGGTSQVSESGRAADPIVTQAEALVPAAPAGSASSGFQAHTELPPPYLGIIINLDF